MSRHPGTAATDPSVHAIPVFEGAESRRHQRVAMWRLHLAGALDAVRHRKSVCGARGFVQFAGWPRSGHSLVGAIIDAHPGAAISHELDAMGLFHKGVPAGRLPGLCLSNAARFTREGRWWNGFRYRIEGGAHGVTPPLDVIGDKKGDWATRWFLTQPDLLGRLAGSSQLRPRWILVTRHPADNIATMSLRRGKAYDRLRISSTGPFQDDLHAAQEAGEIASDADDEMIADYRALADGVARMKAIVPPEDWLEVVYERLGTQPAAELARIETFLGLGSDPDWRRAAAAAVRPSSRRSRDSVAWRADQTAAVADIINSHDFLQDYATDT